MSDVTIIVAENVGAGYTVYRQPNDDDVGGYTYFSNEFGGGCTYFNTVLHNPVIMKLILQDIASNDGYPDDY